MVVGTVRDVEKVLQSNVELISQVLKPIGAFKIFLVESDSRDGTIDELKKLENVMPNFHFVSLGVIKNRVPDRIERLIYCRNIYVQKIRELNSFESIDFVIVVDLDIRQNKLKTEAIEESLESSMDWFGIFANQSKRYYDIAALRHEKWSPKSAFEEFDWYQQFMSKRKAQTLAMYRKMLHIPSSYSPIEVNSAFGGFAIYKSDAFLRFDYTRTEADSSYDIDHVIFNRRIREIQGRLFINPRLINFAWNEHSRGSIFVLRIMQSVIYRIRRLIHR